MTIFKKHFLFSILTIFLIFPSGVYSSPLEILGVVKEAQLIKPNTKVFISCFDLDTTAITNDKGLYHIIFDAPFNSGYVTIKTVDCIGDTNKHFVFYSTNKQLLVIDFDLCKSNFKTYLAGNVYYKRIPARGALIELSLNNFKTILEMVQANDIGRFESFMPTGPVQKGTMYARVKGCNGKYIYNSVDFSDGDTLNLSFVTCKAPGETLLTGQVKQGNFNTMDKGVKLVLYAFDPEQKKLVLTDSVVTTTGGAYEFFLNDTDAYLIKALPEQEISTIIPSYNTGAIFWNENPIIEFQHVHNQVRKDIPMNQLFKTIGDQILEGKIIINSTKGLSRSRPPVLLLSENKDPIAYTYANDNGYYKFKNLPPGDYLVWVDDPGRLTIPVSVKIENGAEKTKAENVVVTDFAIGTQITSQKETIASQSTISLYPNPFVNFIRLNIEEEEFAEVQIVSLSGTVVKKLNVSSNQKIEARDIKSGLYIIIVKTKNKTYIQRMIKN